MKCYNTKVNISIEQKVSKPLQIVVKMKRMMAVESTFCFFQIYDLSWIPFEQDRVKKMTYEILSYG